MAQEIRTVPRVKCTAGHVAYDCTFWLCVISNATLTAQFMINVSLNMIRCVHKGNLLTGTDDSVRVETDRQI